MVSSCFGVGVGEERVVGRYVMVWVIVLGYKYKMWIVRGLFDSVNECGICVVVNSVGVFWCIFIIGFC